MNAKVPFRGNPFEFANVMFGTLVRILGVAENLRRPSAAAEKRGIQDEIPALRGKEEFNIDIN